MPSFVQILDGWDLKGLVGTFGSSDDFEKELEENLPIQKPYWVKYLEESVGKKGIRATWIGHSTVLAEIDGLVVLTDPIFRYVQIYFNFIMIYIKYLINLVIDASQFNGLDLKDIDPLPAL